MDIEKLDLELIAALQGIESQANRKAKRRALSASEIEAWSEELMQLWKSHAHALFGRIQNQSAIFTEADREELMDFANKVATGGMLFAALQEGGRRWVAKLRKSENARDGKSKKAAAWHVTVEALAVKLWVERPNFRDNADKTAAEIYDALTVTCPSAPNQRSVAKYISRADVREQLNKNVCSSN